MDIRNHRKLVNLVRSLLARGFSGTQEQICSLLEERGFRVAQPTVSRIFKRLGVIKVIESGKPVYRLPDTPGNLYTYSFWQLVRSIDHNGYVIVIKTVPEAAMYVAGFLDDHFKREILGTVAGNDTLFAAPYRIENLQVQVEAFRKYLDSQRLKACSTPGSTTR